MGTRQWNQCTFWAGIISHQLFSDMTLCIYSCRGTLSSLFITSPDWNWSRRLWATGKEMDFIRCWGDASAPCCHLNLRKLFIYSSKDTLIWYWRGDGDIMLCLLMWAEKQSWHQPMILLSSAEGVPVSTVCPYSVTRLSYWYAFWCYNVLMNLYSISYWLPPEHPVRFWVKYWQLIVTTENKSSKFAL